MMIVLKHPPPSFFAPQPAATPRNNLLTVPNLTRPRGQASRMPLARGNFRCLQQPGLA